MTIPSDDLEIKVDDSVLLRLQTHETEDQEYRLIMDNFDYLKPWVFWVNDTFDKGTLYRGIEDNLKGFRNKQAYTMGVYVDGVLVGFVDVRNIVAGESAEAGYWIAEQFTGKGLASRCTLRLIDYVREKHDVDNFYLLTMVDNVASSRVAEKMDFHFDSTVDNQEYNIQEKRYVKKYQ